MRYINQLGMSSRFAFMNFRLFEYHKIFMLQVFYLQYYTSSQQCSIDNYKTGQEDRNKKWKYVGTDPKFWIYRAFFVISKRT